MADIKKILSGMTIDEKIGQLMQYNAGLFCSTEAEITGPLSELGLSKEVLKNVGSVLNFQSADEAIQIQKKHLAEDRNKIPMLFMMDVIHGFRTIYPIPLALGCSFDTGLVAECSKMAAREACAGGVHVTFTPMVDYVRDARWGRVMETCGEDPLLNSEMGVAQVRAFQGDDLKKPGTLATCVKHFAAYGGAESGKDYNQVELSEHILREFYFPAYKACIDAGTTMLMPSFNVLNGVPSIANSWLMRNILKDEWGFDGVVISDYDATTELTFHGVAEDMKAAAKLAFENGCDIEMCASGYANHLKELIAEGVFSVEQLDLAVLRVLKLKDKLGLFEDPFRGASKEAEEMELLTPENRTIARRAAEESAVLLKNDGVLPLDKSIRKIALIGPFADTKDITGLWFCNRKAEDSVTVSEGISAMLPDAEIITVSGCTGKFSETDRSGFDDAIAAAKSADAVILCIGEHQLYSAEAHSRADITLPGLQEELALEVSKHNPNTVAVTFSGRPLAISSLSQKIPAILHMWFPGTEGGNAVASLLFGDKNPCGKLSMSFPRMTGQCPVYYNHTSTGRPKPPDANPEFAGFTSGYIDCPNSPLYSFGYGLSYSDFVYESLELSKPTMGVDEEITAKITVRNNSNIPGKETVLLFMQDVVASNARPVQQLIAFSKVDFEAGERKTVEFTIKEPMLRFWNNQHKFVSEPGEFRISTGYADKLIHTKSFILK